MLAAALALSLLLALPAATLAGDRGRKNSKASQNTAWIHVEVTERGADTPHVQVNVPFSLARIALEAAPDDFMEDDGFIEINDTHYTVEDLRRMWQAVREVGDAEFVTVDHEGDQVKIFRRGDRLHANVTEDNGRETVRMEVPVAVVDALLGGSGDTLDLDAALAQLEKMDAGEILRVDDEDEQVRIWIDYQ
jgi:head-tail adaptor